MSAPETETADPADPEAAPTVAHPEPRWLTGPPPTTGGRSVRWREIAGRDLAGRMRSLGRRARRRPLRRGLFAVLLVLVPTVVAAVVSAQQPPTYAAEAEILYRGGQTTTSDTIERELETQRVLMVNRTAIDSAARAVGHDPESVSKRVDTKVVEGSNVLRLRAEDRSRRVARVLVESLVARYTAVVQQSATNRLDAQRQAVDAQIAGANARLAQIGDRVRQITGVGLQQPPPLQAELRALESEADTLRQQVVDLQEQSLQWNVANPDAGMATAEVLAGPTILDKPVGPQPLRAAAGGALVGLLLAFGLVTFSRRRRTAGDSEAVVARP
ncbi:MAG TPA: hypothetical protein VIH08_14505 [Blastococcus sp.]